MLEARSYRLALLGLRLRKPAGSEFPKFRDPSARIPAIEGELTAALAADRTLQNINSGQISRQCAFT